MKKTAAKVILCLYCLCCFCLAPAQASAKQLTLWIHPYLLTSELLNRFSPLTAYLQKKTGHSITIKVSRSYQSHIEKVGKNQFDLAYMGPAPYVEMTNRYGKRRILACLVVKGSPFFHGIIIARQDSQLNSLHGLIGKSFAFGDRNSTMSHIVPHYMLIDAGVSLKDLNKSSFLGSHNDVALAVLGGYYDAGGVKEEIYYQYRDRGLKMLAKSPPVAEHLFVASNELEEDIFLAIRQALVELKDKHILSALKKSVTGMKQVSDEDYNGLRLMMREHNNWQEE